jgi:beta-lactam-binding protein with PASTA domain
MAKLFDISIPEGASNLKLDSQGRGSVHYTVKSLTRTPIDARTVLIPVPNAQADPNHPVAKGWVKIEGKPERHLDVNGEDAFTVTVAIPPKSPAGTYSYRLDVVSAARPDEGDSSPVVTFSVAATEAPKSRWGLIAAIIAIVVVVGGVLGWLVMRKSGGGMPNVVGMNITDATAALTKVNVRIQQPITTKVQAASDADKVLEQSVAPGTKIAPDASIALTVGAELVQVPNIIGQSVADAQKKLSDAHLSLGKATNQPNSNFGIGVIWKQSPDANLNVQTNSAIDVMVTPQTVAVPVLTGISLSDAIARIQSAQLTLGGFFGNQPASNTTGQSIAPGTQVPIGTALNLTFPATFTCPRPELCYYSGATARLLAPKAVQHW